MTCKIFDLHREWYKDRGKPKLVGANSVGGTNSGGRSMKAVENNKLMEIARQVKEKLNRVIDSL